MLVDVSIIVPVYNAERYLSKCIDSILQQTLKNFQLILVNDGSTDKSRDICQGYEIRDKRIIRIDLNNAGPAAARNAGLAVASGDYIGFVDADDWIEPDMYEKLHHRAKETGAALTICDYFTETKKNHTENTVLYSNQLLWSRNEIGQSVFPYFFGYLDSEIKDYKRLSPFSDFRSYIWNGLYKREILSSYSLIFPDEKMYFNEDNLFNLEYIRFADSICHVQECLYHYRISDASFTQSFKPEYAQNKLNKYRYLNERIDSWNLEASYRERLRNKIALESVSLLHYYFTRPQLKRHEKLRWIRHILKEKPVRDSLQSFNLKAVPLFPLRLLLLLEKRGMPRMLMLLMSLHSFVSRTVQILQRS